MTMYPFTATPPAIPARWTASRYRPATSIGNALMVILKAVLDVLVEAQDRARRHNALATLDDRILADERVPHGHQGSPTRSLTTVAISTARSSTGREPSSTR